MIATSTPAWFTGFGRGEDLEMIAKINLWATESFCRRSPSFRLRGPPGAGTLQKAETGAAVETWQGDALNRKN